jgi:FtsH-binding integral membrane protein
MSKASDQETPSMSTWRENDRQLARFYAIHGVLVGGVVFVMVAINSQAAQIDLNWLLLVMLFQQMPMILAAAALWYGWRGARLLVIVLAFVIALSYRGHSTPRTRNDPVAIFCDSQMYNVPGAAVLAIITAGTTLWDITIGRSKGNSESRR